MSDFHNTSVDASRRADALSESADALDGQRLSSFSSRVAIFSALVLLVSQIHAQKPAIPEPLTLVDALTIARDQPLLQLHHRATIELGEARVAATRASLDYRIGLVLEPRTVAKGSALTVINPPGPNPKISRPPLIWSNCAVSAATITGW